MNNYKKYKMTPSFEDSDLDNAYVEGFNNALKLCDANTADTFKEWGAQGGAKSKRVLTAAQAKAMVAAREKKRRKTKRVVRRANNRI